MKIVRTRRYLKDLRRIGASEADAEAIEVAISADPKVGEVIRGLHGIRKMRFGFGSKGKRGGGRAIYFLMVSDDVAVMILAYAKNEQSDLSSAQRKAVLDMLKEFEDE